MLNKEDADNFSIKDGGKSKFFSQESKLMPPLDKNVVISMPSSQEKSSSQKVEKKKEKNSKNSSQEIPNQVTPFQDMSEYSKSQIYDNNSNLLFAPKIAEKKNVLKKISYYVKKIIFNHEWVSRKIILDQVFALDSQALAGFCTSVKANLKRRVYDSINVMVASGIIIKKSCVDNGKKEYYYKPKAIIKREYLISKENIKRRIKGKLISLAKKDDKLKILNSRQYEISRLINLNKKPNSNTVQILNKNKGKLDFTQNFKKKNTKKKKKDNAEIKNCNKIYVPFYLYKLKDRKVVYEFDKKLGKRSFKVFSDTPAFMYQDFEVIKKLKIN